jgi:putative transposase
VTTATFLEAVLEVPWRASKLKSVKNQRYSTNLTKAQWKIIKPMLPQERTGRPRRLCQHAILNALWFVVVTGIQWRLLPREFPAWQSVYYHFRRWSALGYWKRIYHLLRALVRQKMGRHKHPTAGCFDSQSVKTTSVPGVRGFDNGKKVKGRKRHVLCDSQGLVLELQVTAANVSDSQGARCVFGGLGRRRGVTKKLRRVWVDAGYKRGALQWVQANHGVALEVVTRKQEQQGFVLQQHRWVIERTFSWLCAHRRLARDYEGSLLQSEALLWIALSRILLRRLA